MTTSWVVDVLLDGAHGLTAPEIRERVLQLFKDEATVEYRSETEIRVRTANRTFQQAATTTTIILSALTPERTPIEAMIRRASEVDG